MTIITVHSLFTAIIRLIEIFLWEIQVQNKKGFIRIRVSTSSLCAFLPYSSITLSFTRRQTINWFLYTIFGANTCTANGISGSPNSICITQWLKKGLEGFLYIILYREIRKWLWDTKMQNQHFKIYMYRILLNIGKFYDYRKILEFQ